MTTEKQQRRFNEWQTWTAILGTLIALAVAVGSLSSYLEKRQKAAVDLATSEAEWKRTVIDSLNSDHEEIIQLRRDQRLLLEKLNIRPSTPRDEGEIKKSNQSSVLDTDPFFSKGNRLTTSELPETLDMTRMIKGW